MLSLLAVIRISLSVTPHMGSPRDLNISQQHSTRQLKPPSRQDNLPLLRYLTAAYHIPLTDIWAQLDPKATTGEASSSQRTHSCVSPDSSAVCSIPAVCSYHETS
jgi:hypothetical protein